MTKSVFAPALREGDRAAVVAPCGPARDLEAVERGLARLKRWGLAPRLGAHALARRGYLAGDDDARAADLQAALDDPEVRAIFLLRGGYGATRLLERLDLSAFRRRPKPVVGYSDGTALLAAIHRATGCVGLHGPMVATRDACAFDAATEAWQRALLFSDAPPGTPPVDDGPAPRTSSPGVAEGRLIGGNLSLLAALQGTPFAPDADGALLFLEDVGEPPYRIDRMLTQLLQSGFFRGVRGVVFGDFAGAAAPDGTEETDLRWVLRDRCGALGVPTATGFPFGHRARAWSLPFGGRARLDASDPAKPPTLVVLEAAVGPRA
ncbi:MAG TPA: LD-carboxypeptidase [Planctomycetota bacterium]|nr:LD-carboxypeptidase [Planctomycetota bacterium]